MSDEIKKTPSLFMRVFKWRCPPVFIGGVIVLLVFGAWLVANSGACVLYKERKTRMISDRVITAVESYQAEFGRMPVPDGVPLAKGVALVTDQPSGIGFIRSLHGENPRDIPFFNVAEGRSRKGGLMYAKDGTIEGLYDVWGNPFHIVIDTQGDGVLVAKRGNKSETVRAKKCIVFTAGKDRTLGTFDDYRSWVPRLPPTSRWSWEYLRSLLP